MGLVPMVIVPSVCECVCGWTVTWTVWTLAEAKMNHGALNICQNPDTIVSTSALSISLITHTFQVYLPYSSFTLCVVLGISQGKKTNSMSLVSSFGSFHSEHNGLSHGGAVWLCGFTVSLEDQV